MRRVLLLLPILALAGCKEEIPQGAVKVTVTYSGFRPECVLVKARDTEDSGKELSAEVVGKGERTGGSLVVAVLPPSDWGTSVEVEAQAFEKTCAGKVVTSHSARVTITRGEAAAAELQLTATDQDQDGYVAVLSGGTDCRDTAAAVNPEAQELCNDVDDNCNGQQDTVELQLGQGCTEGASCAGTRRCGDNGTVVCNVPNATLAYPDGDRDNRGDRNAIASSFCTGVPAGFVTGPNDDCDDTRANVFPGAQERCDGLDNDCDGPSDEDYPQLNAACTDPATQCGGQLRCSGGGDALVCVVTQSMPTWYLDEDGDGFGQNDGAQQTCVRPTGTYVNQGNDCDDGNRFTFPGAEELCDALDNNCDDQPEAAAACPGGTRSWVERIDSSSGQLWSSVSTWTPGGVWAVGENNGRALLVPGQTAFQLLNGACANGTTDWNTVWADPNDGRAYFGAASGRLVYQDTTTTGCTQPTETGNDLAVFGLVGLRTNGTLAFHGVSESTSSGEGAAFRWDGATTLTFNSASNDVAFVYDIHGVSRAALFSVGGYDPGSGFTAGPRIYRFDPSNNQWDSQLVQNTISGLSRLRGIWVVNEKLAFAVGNTGSVVRWNGTIWSKVDFPNTHDLTSVVAFGANSAYATCASGHVYRYSLQDWQVVHSLSGTQFNDISGTSPEDLWVVGTNGKIFHWPR